MYWKELLRETYNYASAHSEDISTQCGASLVDPYTGKILVHGCNHFPSVDYHTRPKKYAFIEHAERDVIYKAARSGIKTQGLIMVAPWACCSDCARAIVLAGITTVVAHKEAWDRSPERWKESLNYGMEILRAGNVIYFLYQGKIELLNNLFDGKYWEP
jgi:dCMP deaminase